MQSCVLPALKPGSRPLGGAVLTPGLYRALGCAAQRLREQGLQGQRGLGGAAVLQAGGRLKDRRTDMGGGDRGGRSRPEEKPQAPLLLSESNDAGSPSGDAVPLWTEGIATAVQEAPAHRDASRNKASSRVSAHGCHGEAECFQGGVSPAVPVPRTIWKQPPEL